MEIARHEGRTQSENQEDPGTPPGTPHWLSIGHGTKPTPPPNFEKSDRHGVDIPVESHLPFVRDLPRASERQRLLLIEDHLPLAQMTAELLREAGLEVRLAISAEEALRIAAVFLPEIVLCDMSLPDMSGIDLARAFRASPNMKNVFIGIHTGMDALRLEDVVSSAGINMILPKPLTQTKIDELLAENAKLRRITALESA